MVTNFRLNKSSARVLINGMYIIRILNSNKRKLLHVFQYSTLDPPATLENSGHQLAKKMNSIEEHISMKLDKINSNYSEIGGIYKQIAIALQEKKKREIRYTSITIYIHIYAFTLLFSVILYTY